MKNYRPPHIGGASILQVILYLPYEHALVLLVSDFQMPLEAFEEALVSIQRYHMCPSCCRIPPNTAQSSNSV